MPTPEAGDSVENLLHEDRHFPPTPEFVAQANATPALYEAAAADRLAFWDDAARALHWDQPWTKTLEWNLPFSKWFIGGKLNASYNCLDRHVIEGRGDRVAFHFEGEPGDTRTITYAQMLDEVKKCANALIELGKAIELQFICQ
jgi:acetyl-CoA synthetase